ncbi:MAG: phage holin family protein [Lachnospiraceae bacterium]|nr:phage holin family protein [Lachnospiraceae bacterium]
MIEWKMFQIAFAVAGGWIGWFLGGADGLMWTLVAFMAFDYVTGLMCAVVEKKLSSEVGFKGIFKKICILIMVGIGNLIDVNVIGSGAVLRTAVIFFYLSNEGISILENVGFLGLPIPQKLRDVLIQLHDKAEEATEQPTQTMIAEAEAQAALEAREEDDLYVDNE